jgi:hypothetical protein
MPVIAQARPSGRVLNLDPGDAELVFVKRFDGVTPES